MSESESVGTGARKPVVLFVDDEPRVLEGMRRSLRRKRDEWELCFAGGVEEALGRLRSGDVDAIVSDINMPLRDGFDLLATVRADARLADVPVVIVTGNGEHGLKRRALDLGATDLLAKPVDTEDLIARLGSALRLKRAQDAVKAQNATLEERVRKRTEDLERARIELVWRLGKAGEFRDSETGLHVARVGFFSRRIAQELGLDAALAKAIFLTSPLHDIGKIGIPDSILLKPGKLTEEEWAIMRTHTVLGADLLRDDPFSSNGIGLLVRELGLAPEEDGGDAMLRIAANIAGGHHERWDGDGYPEGLAGEAIPLEARITSLADVFDALGSKRPYKPAFSDEEVLARIDAGAGTQFDPEAHRAFHACLPDLLEIREELRDEDPPALGPGALARAG